MEKKNTKNEVGNQFAELSVEEMEKTQGAGGDDMNGETFWASAAISGATGLIISKLIS